MKTALILKHIRNATLITALAVPITMTGCVKKIASTASGSIFYDATPSIDAEDDVELAEQSSLGFLKMLEGLQIADPGNKKILYLLTRSYSGYAYGFTENAILSSNDNDAALNTAMERAKRFYSRAKEYGMLLLSKNGSFKKGLTSDLDTFKKSLKSFSKTNVPELFWAGHAWGNFLNFSKDSPEAVVEMPKIQALMERVVELDPTYYHGAPLAFLGGFFGSRPKLIGGDPDKSKDYFEKALAVSEGKNLLVKVAYAQFYAVQTQNQELFKKLLEEVRMADPMALKDLTLVNKLAQIRAQLLLERSDDFFESAVKNSKRKPKESGFETKT